MRVINRIITYFTIICMLSVSVFAEESYFNSNSKWDIEKEFVSDIDNSDLYVKVIKQNGTKTSTIFTGKLIDYDNGSWVNVDFSDIDFLVLFEWEDNEDDATYIIPLESLENVSTDINEKNIPQTDEVNDNLTLRSSVNLPNSSIKCDVNLLYDGNYSERIIIKNKQLNVPIKITNTGNEQESVVCYIGEYNSAGVLIDTVATSAITINANQSIATNITKTFSSEAETVKIFIWDSETIRPITNPISLSETDADYYADTFADTQTYDISYYVTGNINTVDDIDIIKFIPENSGNHTINCISASDITTTLYNRNYAVLKNNFSSYKYSLTAGQEYYIKMYNTSGGTGEYVLSVQYDTPSEADDFNIYDFDIDTNVYKKAALSMCEDLYYDDIETSKQMYSEYENILKEETKIHRLPDFLAEHPKELSNFDEIVNQYYSTKYNDLSEIREEYVNLIDRYTDIETEPGEVRTINNEGENRNNAINDECPIVGKHLSDTFSAEDEEELDNNGENEEEPPQRTTASLTITGTTSTSITYSVTFPSSGAKGNAIWLVDFNNSNGLTTEYNVYGSSAIYRTNGTYTINGLQPGGIYILEMLWSTNGGSTYGYENSVDRFVQLPCNTTETLQMYEGSGRVSAQLEPEDKALASNANFNTWLERMDSAYNSFRELTGYTPYNAQKIIMKSTRQNLNEYFNIVDGQNYWWVTFGYYDYTRIFKHSKAFNQGLLRRLSQGDWGDTPMHELSHTFDCYSWNFDSETLAQFKLYYVISTLNAKVYRPDRFNNNGNGWYTGTNYYTLLKTDRYLDSYTNSFNQGTYASEGFAAILIEIQQQIGWEPFKKTFRYFSDLSYSQMPDTDGEKLKLFLTKLKDYSGRDVLSYISTRDKNIINNHYNISLGYVAPVIPITSGGTSSVISADSGQYATYEFTPSTSGNYYIYTSPYAGSGISNDTYIEVYTDSAMTNSNLIASNDDYDGGRFSKVNVAMTSGITYYIKVRHYRNGKLLSQIHITKNVPTINLTLDGYDDVYTYYGDYAKYEFTPSVTGSYVFEVTGYNGGSLNYDTYIKLYENESMTKQIGNDNTKIIANLNAGHTYYLQFSGFLMRYARGRINLYQGQTLKFNKKTDSNYIYVNSPEYITRFDIVDDISHTQAVLDKTVAQPYMKLSEFENISGKNTFYETHTAWWGALVNDGNETYCYDPLQQFYMDIDMYNPTSSAINVSIENLAYGTSYSVLQQYYNGGYSFDVTIPPYSHVPILSHIGAPLLCTDPQGTTWARIPVILFDFTVNSGNIVVSSLAAYNTNNLYLRNGTNNVVDNTGAILDSGNVIYAVDGYGNPAWGSPNDPRRNETDLYAKVKGIARNESAWIDSNIDVVIDNNTNIGNPIPLTLKDNYYTYGIANPKWYWKSSINPLNDAWEGVLTMLPNGLHNFKYHYANTNRQWYFDFQHRDLRYFDINGNSQSINDAVPADIIDNAKLDMSIGQKAHFGESEAPDEYSMSIGEWGATYHYTVNVKNTTDVPRTVYVKTWSAENLIVGLKQQGETSYSTQYYTKIYNTPDNPTTTAAVSVPANSTKTFEFVTLLGGGLGGLNHSIVIE